MKSVSEEYFKRSDLLNMTHIRFSEACWSVFEQTLSGEQRENIDEDAMLHILWLHYDFKNRTFDGQSLSEDIVQFLTQEFEPHAKVSLIEKGTKVFTLNGEVLTVEAVIKLKPHQLLNLESPYLIKFVTIDEAYFYNPQGHEHNQALSPNTILEIV